MKKEKDLLECRKMESIKVIEIVDRTFVCIDKEPDIDIVRPYVDIGGKKEL